MYLKLLLRIDKTNSRGEVVDSYIYNSRSLLWNFATFTSFLLGLSKYLGKTIDGIDVNATSIAHYPYKFFYATAGAGDYQTGIVVGSGTTPVSISDYRLESWITHGTDTNQLLYGAHVPEGVSTTSFSIARSFTNNGTSYVTVNEVGLSYRSEVYNGVFLIVRDVIPGGVVVGPGQGLVVRYIFTISA